MLLVVIVSELLGSIGMILSFVSHSFFFFLPYSVVIFFSLWEPARELRTEGKKQEYLLNSNFYLRFKRLFCGVGLFPEPVEIVASPR